jgi:hypothetical protein
MSSKRKSSNTHYERDCDDEFNIYEFNRNTSKKNRIYSIPEICNICGFGKLNNICRCIINTNNINVDEYIIKMCNFCNDPVSICDCNIVLWSTFNCNSCRIAHSVYRECTSDEQCIICDKKDHYTNIGCRCFNSNIKFINTDVNLRKLGDTQDFAEFLNKSEFQPVCSLCENHLAKCACLENVNEGDYQMKEADYNDEYEQMYMD